MTRRLLAFALTFVFALSLRAQSDADQRSAAEIRALFEQFNAAWERRDSTFINRFYANDPDRAFFFERRQLIGWPRVDTLYRNMFSNAARGRVRSLSDVLDVGARGNMGWLAANFRLEVIEPSGDTTVDAGRQSLVLERREGRWVVVHRHTSFQAPPGPQRQVPLHVTPGPLWSPADDTTGGPEARAIRQRREASNAAIARHDIGGFGAALAPQLTIVTSNSVHATDRAQYVARMAEQFRSRSDVIYRRTPSAISVYAPWRMASEQGRWTGSWTEPDGKVNIQGTYFAKWRQRQGDWFIESETYMPDRCTGSAYCLKEP